MIIYTDMKPQADMGYGMVHKYISKPFHRSDMQWIKYFSEFLTHYNVARAELVCSIQSGHIDK